MLWPVFAVGHAAAAPTHIPTLTEFLASARTKVPSTIAWS